MENNEGDLSPIKVKEVITEVEHEARYQKLKRAYVKYAKWLGVFLLPLLFYVLYLHGELNSKMMDLSSTTAQRDSIAYLAKQFKNTLGQVVTENIAIKAQNDRSLKDLSSGYFSLKDKQEELIKQVKFFANVKQITRVDTVFIPFDDQYAVANSTGDSIAVPQRFIIEDTARSIAGRVTKKGVQIDSLKLFNELSIRFGTKKTGFLNLGRKDFVQAINSNKYVTNNGLYSQYLPTRISRWNKWIKPTLSATLAAYLTSRLLK